MQMVNILKANYSIAHCGVMKTLLTPATLKMIAT
jgi:hypothetical protein